MGTGLFGSLDLKGFNFLGFVVSAVSGLPSAQGVLANMTLCATAWRETSGGRAVPGSCSAWGHPLES